MPKNIEKEIRGLYEKLKREFQFYQPEMRLPSMRVLEMRHQCSRQTLKYALDRLKKENIIYTKDRSGMFVSSRKQNQTIRRILFIRVDWPCTHANEMSEVFQETFRKHPGYVFIEMRYPPLDLENFLNILKTISADLVILWLEKLHPSSLLNLCNLGIPTLFFDCGFKIPYADIFDLQEYMFGMIAAKELISRGHRKLAFLLTEPLGMTCREKLNGFCDYARINGINPEVIGCKLYNGEVSSTPSLRYLTRYFAEHPIRFTGCFASNSDTALKLFKHLGKRVPDDISLIACSTWKQTQSASVREACVCFDTEKIANELFSSVDAYFHGKSLGIHRVPPRFFEGYSLKTINKK